jgi:hypothetical protein
MPKGWGYHSFLTNLEPDSFGGPDNSMHRYKGIITILTVAYPSLKKSSDTELRLKKRSKRKISRTNCRRGVYPSDRRYSPRLSAKELPTMGASDR